MEKSLDKEMKKQLEDVNPEVADLINDAVKKTEEAADDKFKEFDKDIENVMGEVDNAQTDAIINALQKDKDNSEINLSELKGDKRLPGEDFDAYKKRRKEEKKLRKKYQNGKVVWKSIFDGPKKGTFEDAKS